ncbi:MAG TPA: glycosyl hydrolase family 18 protein [Bacteroidia bacterium]|nr:glycosyl hydrolase family 18 protein [Bacteroidia bacterium]HRH07249.1 glycosyl hydrolase family 18 protein [Bacteroidia bacterium]
MKKIFFILFLKIQFFCALPLFSSDLIGYWHNWNDVNAPYIPFTQIDSRYTIIEVAFAVPTSPSDMTMTFVPDGITQAQFITQIQTMQSLGKKVLLSIGGANTSIDLTSVVNKNAFVSSLTGLINTYGFDGIDIDIENGNSILALGGTIASPTNVAQINLIDAIQQIMSNYRLNHNSKLWLTMAPETAYIQGGQSAFGGIWGGYLPLVHALRDSIDILQVQLYNSGSMFGIDGQIYTQGNSDFIIAMTEAAIQGFNTGGGFFQGLPASKIAVGLPACTSAAGGGFADTTAVKNALNYLLGIGPKPGNYTLVQASGYTNLRGMMTWSINWDAVSTCGSQYEYAQNYQQVFTTATGLSNVSNTALFSLFPNPAKSYTYLTTANYSDPNNSIKIFGSDGRLIQTVVPQASKMLLNIEQLDAGVYFIKQGNYTYKLIKL